MIGQPQRQPRWAQIAGWTIVAFAVVGLIYLARLLILAVVALIRAPGVEVSVTHVWSALFSRAEPWVGIATVALAIATVALWKATRALSRSTNVGISIGGPLLVPVLYPPQEFRAGQQELFANIVLRPYWAGWVEQDRREATGIIVQGDGSHVSLYLLNRSQTSHGAAVKISVRVSLHFGNLIGQYQYEHVIL